MEISEVYVGLSKGQFTKALYDNNATKKELAKRWGVSPSYITHFLNRKHESGLGYPVSMPRLRALSELTGKPIKELVSQFDTESQSDGGGSGAAPRKRRSGAKPGTPRRKKYMNADERHRYIRHRYGKLTRRKGEVWMSVKDLCNEFRLGRATVHGWVAANSVPHKKVGKERLVLLSDPKTKKLLYGMRKYSITKKKFGNRHPRPDIAERNKARAVDPADEIIAKSDRFEAVGAEADGKPGFGKPNLGAGLDRTENGHDRDNLELARVYDEIRQLGNELNRAEVSLRQDLNATTRELAQRQREIANEGSRFHDDLLDLRKKVLRIESERKRGLLGFLRRLFGG